MKTKLCDPGSQQPSLSSWMEHGAYGCSIDGNGARVSGRVRFLAVTFHGLLVGGVL